MMLVPDEVRSRAEILAADEAASLCLLVSDAVPADEGPAISVFWRIKSSESIREKRLRHPLASGINDFIGIRLILAHVGHLDLAIAAVRGWAATRGFVERDYANHYAKPRPDFYRAVHLDFAVPSESGFAGPEPLGLEIQITTYLQNFHSTIRHQLTYDRNRSELKSFELSASLKKMSHLLSDIDQEIGALFGSLHPPLK